MIPNKLGAAVLYKKTHAWNRLRPYRSREKSRWTAKLLSYFLQRGKATEEKKKLWGLGRYMHSKTVNWRRFRICEEYIYYAKQKHRCDPDVLLSTSPHCCTTYLVTSQDCFKKCDIFSHLGLIYFHLSKAKRDLTVTKIFLKSLLAIWSSND